MIKLRILSFKIIQLKNKMSKKNKLLNNLLSQLPSQLLDNKVIIMVINQVPIPM